MSCCKFTGNFDGDPEDDCSYNPGGLVSVKIANACDVQAIEEYEGYYPALNTQPTLGPPAYPFGLTDPADQKLALYKEHAVADIIMLPQAGPIPRFQWFDVIFSDFTAGAIIELIGGGKAGAKYWQHTLTLVVPLTDQWALNKVYELGNAKICAIIEIKQQNSKLAKEVAAITGLPKSPENRFFLIGGRNGMPMTVGTNNFGPTQDDVNGQTLTFVGAEIRNAQEITPFIDSGYNTGTSAPGKYLSTPYISPSPFAVNLPLNNLNTKLLQGAA
jgi:hypothetical protein